MRSQRINFTIRALHDIQTPENGKRTWVYDEKVRGLVFGVTAKGRKSFYVYKKVHGKPERIFLGNFPELSVEQARTRALELCSRIANGANPQEELRIAKEELTVDELFAHYIERHARKKCKTVEPMIKDFNRNMSSIRQLKLSQVSHDRAENLHQLLAQKRGTSSANRAVQLLRAVYNKGIAWNLHTGDNPFRNITMYPEKPRERFLSTEEARLMIRELESECSTLRDFIKLSLLTGVRKNNLMSMRWSDVDLKQALWVIPDTKNGTSQTVALGPFDISVLEERKAAMTTDSPYVFPGTGKTGHLRDIKKSWTTFKRRIGIEDVTIHDLRRSLGAGMANQNINIALIKDALHHKDLKTTLNVYARTRKEAVRDAKVVVHTQWFSEEAADHDGGQ